MKVGFTGTKRGMIKPQREKFRRLIGYLTTMTEFHHGDCIGADAYAHDVVRMLYPDVKIIKHPPINPKYQAFKQCDEVRQPREYLERNAYIVAECELLIATPFQQTDIMRSGTWSTIRSARLCGCAHIILPPIGPDVAMLPHSLAVLMSQ